eukprot:9690438-Heterocapsa_arctica.AAC.1
MMLVAHHSHQLVIHRHSVLSFSNCFSLKFLSARDLLHVFRFHYQAPSVELRIDLRLEIGNLTRVVRGHFVPQLIERLGLVDLQICGAQL